MNKYKQRADKEGRVIDPALPHTGQAVDRQTRFTYDKGPMYYLGEQIVRAMQDSGYPAYIWQCYRPPEEQAEYFAKGTSKARPWESGHQFYQAVDILHPELLWEAPPDYWEQLAACVRIVAARFGVELEHGHYWPRLVDSAHIEMKDWRVFRDFMREQWRLEMEQWQASRRVNPDITTPPPEPRPPSEDELNQRFAEVLPNVWKQHIRPPASGLLPEFFTRRTARTERRKERRTEWREWWQSRPRR